MIINSVSDYDTSDTSIEAFSTTLFNLWGIGDAARNNGVLIVMAVGDRDVRIELGAGYDSSYDARMQAVIDDHMLPHFREGHYSRGLYRGSRALVADLTGDGPRHTADLNAFERTDAEYFRAEFRGAFGARRVTRWHRLCGWSEIYSVSSKSVSNL